MTKHGKNLVRWLRVKDFIYSDLLTGINLSLYGSHISGSIPFTMPWNLWRWGAITGFPETSLAYVWDTCRYENSWLRCCTTMHKTQVANNSSMASPFLYQQFLLRITKSIQQWKIMRSNQLPNGTERCYQLQWFLCINGSQVLLVSGY